jgi:hypothetical protein
MSRVEACDAWQIAFNQLIYYASFLEETSVKWGSEDIDFLKNEFSTVCPTFPTSFQFLLLSTFKADQASGTIYSVSAPASYSKFKRRF